jgi:hypothetical protein
MQRGFVMYRGIFSALFPFVRPSRFRARIVLGSVERAPIRRARRATVYAALRRRRQALPFQRGGIRVEVLCRHVGAAEGILLGYR